MKKQPINVKTGEFPYPLIDGPCESRYLTWIRNHSNYMAERGFLDYFRLVAVLIRGILVNALTLLPYVLIMSVVLAYSYNNMLKDWDAQVTADKTNNSIQFFATREITDDTPGLARSFQNRLYPTHLIAVSGTWAPGDEVTTKLTEKNSQTSLSIVTTVEAGATKSEDVRDLHLLKLIPETDKQFEGITWTKRGSDRIVATTTQAARGIEISATTTAESSHFDYRLSRPPTPFLLSPIALALFAGYVFLFPIVARIFKIAGYKKALETGTSSSVKIRDKFERSFGGLLLVVLAVFLIESLPLMVHYFHQLRVLDGGWAFPTGAGALGALAVANKLLPLLGGWLQKLMLVLVGALGLLIPFLGILLFVEFMVYADPYQGPLLGALFLLPVFIALLLLVVMVIGIGNFKLKGYQSLVMMLIGMVILFFAGLTAFLFTGEHKNFVFILVWAIEIWVFCWLIVDVNLTSINGLYRDRLASAFLVGVDNKGDVDIEQDIDLQEICRYDAGSTAPYHLVNVALNLQGSKDIAIRERNSDFFIFSKRFIGGERTGYCKSENLELVYPQMDLAAAMSISAAAASPNMGRGTNPLMVAFMTLLNVRLGFWLPNPGRLEKALADGDKNYEAPGFSDVFREELDEIKRRRQQAYPSNSSRPLDDKKVPTTAHNLVGIGFSGGGIRSATINLGIAQALQQRGVFDHIDYMSTVSGGGYLGSSISTLMRYKVKPFSEITGTVSVKTTDREKIVTVQSTESDEVREYRYSNDAELHEKILENDAKVEAGQPLIQRRAGCGMAHATLMDRFAWRVRPSALLHEMISMLDENRKWVNLSDGGHIENLATIELLRRRCRFIIIGDGEADPNLYFDGLATLIRYARIDLGIKIDIRPDAIRVDKSSHAIEMGTDNLSTEHYVFGTITYPTCKDNNQEQETGYLLYLKSSFTGDEEEVIMEYRNRNSDFPHESTADQFFDEGQFEAYRSLGQHIAEHALKNAPETTGDGKLPFSYLETWFTEMKNR